MEFYKRFKNFWGLSKEDDSSALNRENSHSIVPYHNETDRDHRLLDEYDQFGFDMFANTMRIHKYLEQQMSEMIKSFGMYEHNSMFGDDGAGGDLFFDKTPFEEDFLLEQPDAQDSTDNFTSTLRDRYLKSGYEPPNSNRRDKTDKDVDGKFDMGDLDSVLKGKPTPDIKPKTFFFSKSVTSKSIRKPDGTYEIHKTVRDQDGNEETTITRTQGDKTYTITTKVDKEGHQEVIKNMVNMDENDTLAGDNVVVEKDQNRLPPNWFPYNRFFKL